MRDDQFIPLSATQEPIWLEQLRYPDRVSAGFFLVTIRGKVTHQELSGACAAVCAAHPELRGMIVDRDGTYQIQIHDDASVFEFDELHRPCSAGEEAEVSRTWYLANRAPRWDLTRRSPIRFHLLWHASDRCTLLIAVHHIAFDGRSKFEFARQFTCALRELREATGLPPRSTATEEATLALSAIREDRASERVDAEELATAVQIWSNFDLRRFPGLILPVPDQASEAGTVAATERFELPADVCERLARVSSGENASFFAGLLANTAALLAAYGNDRMVLSIPADTSTEASRRRIGMQVNMVPCVIETHPGMTFRQLVVQTAQALAHVHRFRRLPFHLLMRELRRTSGVDLGPGIFDRIGVSFPRTITDLGDVPGLGLVWDFFAPNSTRSFQLTFQLRRAGDRAFGRLDFDTSVFDAELADTFAGQWHKLLTDAMSDPDMPIVPESVGVVRTGECAQPAAEGDDKSASRFHQQVASLAEAMPQAPCLITSRGVVSYEEAVGILQGAQTLRRPQGVEGAKVRIPVRPCRAEEALARLAPGIADPEEAGTEHLGPRFVLGHLAAAGRIGLQRGPAGLVIAGHSPGSTAFTGTLVRALADGSEIQVPDLADTVAASPLIPWISDLVRSGRECVVEGPSEWLDLLVSVWRKGALKDPGRVVVVCPADRFLPTTMRADLVHRGVRVVLGLEDPRIGPVAWGNWNPDPESPHRPPQLSEIADGWHPIVLAADGRALPPRTPGRLALRPEDGGAPMVTDFRARISGQGQVSLLGRTDQALAFGGRVLDLTEAERRVATLPGVVDAAVVPSHDEKRGAPVVFLVRDGSDSVPDRVWRKRVLRVWPAATTPPARVSLVGRLPRDWTGELDRRAVALLHGC
ncbi:condensation domain-containing protein [Streptomyces sp. GbtcB6]|uniref:condensation domain-containing protein n=1 Tax=Streptomyces sp. GbtcB6 TaxID=2824751 RepID=UPI001C30A3AC|nr:condensation domain-containing protein [Streptomyces sp. GbtcB6]